MKTVIVTATFYKNLQEVRYQMALKTIQEATNHGYDIVIIDGSPDSAVADSFKKAGAFVYPETIPGMEGSRRLAFFYGCQHILSFNVDSAIIWIEAEKYDFVRNVDNMVKPIEEGKAAITIPVRNFDLFKEHYPAFQVESEIKANYIYSSATGRVGYDVFAGPVAMTLDHAMRLSYWRIPNGVNEFARGYIQLLYPISVQNVYVSSVPVDFIYPLEQKIEEEARDNQEIRKKRLDQLNNIGDAFKYLGKIYKENI